MDSLFCFRLKNIWCANLSLQVSPLLFLFTAYGPHVSTILSLLICELSLLFTLGLPSDRQVGIDFGWVVWIKSN